MSEIDYKLNDFSLIKAFFERRRTMHKAKALMLTLLMFVAFAGCRQEPVAAEKGGAAGGDSATVEKQASSRNEDEADVQVSESEDIKTPSISFEHTEYNFGEVVSGTKVKHVFTFKNVGDAELKILKVGSS